MCYLVLPLPLFLSTPTRFITASHFGGSPTKYIICVGPKPNTSSHFHFYLFWFLREFSSGSVRGFQFTEWRNIGYILGHSRSPRHLGYFQQKISSILFKYKTKFRNNVANASLAQVRLVALYVILYISSFESLFTVKKNWPKCAISTQPSFKADKNNL